jgi:glutamyl-tRNA reductase
MDTDLKFLNITTPCNIGGFFIAGINYKKTDASMRGMFTISHAQYQNILNLAPAYGISSLFIISTCNRTEIYGFADQPAQLINLLCTQTLGNATSFNQLAYIKTGKKAIKHLFNVGAGLDSQILGDYEIIGQLKQAVKFAKDRNFINCFLERLVNDVLQSSKTIKNETSLSDGTVSVSFAAIKYIKETVTNLADKKILLLGTGKIGSNTCKNMVDYLGTTNITLINRTEEKAINLAAKLNLKHAPMARLNEYIASADIIITATNSEKPTILYAQLESSGPKLVIDLSIPYNVEASSGQLSNIKLVNVDELSKLNDVTVAQRQAEVPKAKKIINTYITNFLAWNLMRKNAPMLKAIKCKLNEIATLKGVGFKNGETNCVATLNDQLIQQVIKSTANKMRHHNHGGCYYIQAINEFVKAAYQ